jgi:hypothetical protein
MSQRSTDDIQDGLLHFLSGYVQGCPEHLDQVLRYPHWQERAKAEVERRIIRLMESFDLETVVAIAEGRVDVLAVAKQLVPENH